MEPYDIDAHTLHEALEQLGWKADAKALSARVRRMSWGVPAEDEFWRPKRGSAREYSMLVSTFVRQIHRRSSIKRGAPNTPLNPTAAAALAGGRGLAAIRWADQPTGGTTVLVFL